MATQFDSVYDIFFKRVVKDPDFFAYTNVPDVEVIDLMKTNAFDYMIESISTIVFNSEPEVDFNDYDTVTNQFNFDLTTNEIQLLVGLMFEKFLSRDIAKLKIYGKHFTTNEIKIFSPAEDRKTFMDMFNGICLKNKRSLKAYSSRDRLTGKLKSYSEV